MLALKHSTTMKKELLKEKLYLFWTFCRKPLPSIARNFFLVKLTRNPPNKFLFYFIQVLGGFQVSFTKKKLIGIDGGAIKITCNR